ncbi:hypothetical protein K3G39_02340 [Pontibacter sp. HSC-14F20]|uniref:DUF6678 family protein n=1 Tax=Pontibacter sp. HSC-14F20 TaxID=2864136 RepID=UPI001C7365E5|nr:DUF6678 family protein [Pontibacter sp. HSC-14F20]MBX0332068.1 hypothetical protein [Pontibacter sp. HSC-14F20]
MVESIDVLARILEKKRLVPVMNQTKWRELIGTLCQLTHMEPEIRIKYLHDAVEPVNFAPIWWEELEQTGLKNIEWMEIKVIREISVGLLSPTLQADYTDLIQEVLDRYAIPYKAEGAVFRITGYQQLQ